MPKRPATHPSKAPAMDATYLPEATVSLATVRSHILLHAASVTCAGNQLSAEVCMTSTPIQSNQV